MNFSLFGMDFLNMQPNVFPNANKIGNYTNKIHYLRTNLVDELPKLTFGEKFLDPVDPQNEPNYYTIIEKPMDLKTISQRVYNFYYKNSKALIKDIFLLINNCKRYYKPDDPQYIEGFKLEQFALHVIMSMPQEQEVPCTLDKTMLDRRILIGLYYMIQIAKNLINQFSIPALNQYFNQQALELTNKLRSNQFTCISQVNIEMEKVIHDTFMRAEMTRYN